MSSTILQRSGWPSAWELWVRRPDAEWRRYSVYETHEQAKATMKRVEGPPLPVWHLGSGKDKARPERKYKR